MHNSRQIIDYIEIKYDEIKQEFFQDVTVSILLHNSTIR